MTSRSFTSLYGTVCFFSTYKLDFRHSLLEVQLLIHSNIESPIQWSWFIRNVLYLIVVKPLHVNFTS